MSLPKVLQQAFLQSMEHISGTGKTEKNRTVVNVEPFTAVGVQA